MKYNVSLSEVSDPGKHNMPEGTISNRGRFLPTCRHPIGSASRQYGLPSYEPPAAGHKKGKRNQ